jgi:carboxypeptidase C (cathepsin A)
MDYDQITSSAEHDPLDSAIGGPYTAAMNYLLRNFLHYDVNDIFRSSCYAVCHWDWERLNRRDRYGFNQGYADVSVDLRQAMIDNPQLKLFVSCGYYDLATPYFAAVYTYAHLNIGELQKNITMKCYRSGHVSYLRPETHAHMYKDMEAFYRTSS